MTKAYKLFRVRKNGTIGPLFINRSMVIPIGKWLKAEDHPTSGFAHRVGWHATRTPDAPHMSIKDRVWYEVEVKNFKEIERPKNQGGKWILAGWIKVTQPIYVDNK